MREEAIDLRALFDSFGLDEAGERGAPDADRGVSRAASAPGRTHALDSLMQWVHDEVFGPVS